MASLQAAFSRFFTGSIWVLAASWCIEVRRFLQGEGLADISAFDWDLCPVKAEDVALILPIGNDSNLLRATVATLLEQDYPFLRVIAVDDCATDDTGAVLDRLALQSGMLEVIHITEPADGWIRKTFAMEVGARQSHSEWLLFMEAGMLLSPSVLRRAVTFAAVSRADHLTVLPTPSTRVWLDRIPFESVQRITFSFLELFTDARLSGGWCLNAGTAFSLVRREAWDDVGGFGPQRLALADSWTLQNRMHTVGYHLETVIAPGMLVAEATKNTDVLSRAFGLELGAMLHFRFWTASLVSVVLWVLFLAPLAGFVHVGTAPASLISLVCIAVVCRSTTRTSILDATAWWSYPIAVFVLSGSLLFGVTSALLQQGVWWQGSFYHLKDLRLGEVGFSGQGNVHGNRRDERLRWRLFKKTRQHRPRY